jgi:hypothetical protein
MTKNIKLIEQKTLHIRFKVFRMDESRLSELSFREQEIFYAEKN